MGCKVVITARKADELGEAKQHLSRGIEVRIANDLRRWNTFPRWSPRRSAFGPIDILVNNAGATWGAKAEEYPNEAWRKVMTLNIDAMFFLSREVARKSMIGRRSGKIVNVASIAGLYGGSPDMHTIAYNTSKGAAVNFTRALASEWGGYNINVNASAPVLPHQDGEGNPERWATRDRATPLKRLGATRLKGVVCSRSEAARHVTGQYIAVDGGISIA